ncbi:hypothetical protein CEUSTIGMA_g4713.t1 [Chlamydomonas eustigma]|uniref:Uncharacterized protein n=1 Tax=Chlamydomonas eustigma TaxID=1157962 RepID=A0A250X2G4_9CHLO|nr:hypothetical protein CEUSTIGMA_g4713.t1 [Chlamydomonas eustigma]|eukprot:GAX77267.1 hypothetical protein CEUSTIGMA_g4713.t1 [Chlamydomonas eustigma]
MLLRVGRHSSCRQGPHLGTGRRKIGFYQQQPHIQSEIASLATNSTASDVIVLDFDGVLVDSEPEITASALVAARERWPQAFSHLNLDREAAVKEKMRIVRPVLVRGFESMVMLRMLVEDLNNANKILENWSQVLPAQLDMYGETQADLSALYERVRNSWMTEKPESWMQLHKEYPGVTDALRECPYPLYFASSKAGHRVSALMRAVMDLEVPKSSPSLYASLIPPEEAKADALRSIMTQPVCKGVGASLHFVDDRLETLLAIQKDPGLASKWKLYLASWGYCTSQEVTTAARTSGITILNLNGFKELLRFGLVMSVHDVCEPVQLEVEQ